MGAVTCEALLGLEVKNLFWGWKNSAEVIILLLLLFIFKLNAVNLLLAKWYEHIQYTIQFLPTLYLGTSLFHQTEEKIQSRRERPWLAQAGPVRHGFLYQHYVHSHKLKNIHNKLVLIVIGLYYHVVMWERE